MCGQRNSMYSSKANIPFIYLSASPKHSSKQRMVPQMSTKSPTNLACLLVLVFVINLSSNNGMINGAANKIRKGESISVSETIVSASGRFELGFFSPQNSTNFYVGIWLYTKNVSEYCVWIANRDYPVLTSSAILTINPDGNIVISDGKMVYMVTNTSKGKDTYAILMDSGNLILKDSNSEQDHDLIWQSFDNPTDTLLPGMSFKYDDSYLVSWKSEADPAPGNFSLKLDSAKKQLVIRNRSNTYWLSGDASENEGSLLGMVLSKGLNGNLYLGMNHESTSSDRISRLVLGKSGKLILQSCSAEAQLCFSIWEWSKCGPYASCGAYSICDESTKSCSCLPGFEPDDNWRPGGNSRGCEKKIGSQCSNPNQTADKFCPNSTIEFPNGALMLEVENSAGCKSACLKNCSLIAYAYSEGHGCFVWDNSSFFNLRQFPKDQRDATYINLKVSASEICAVDIFPETHGGHGNVKGNILLTVLSIVALVLLTSAIFVSNMRIRFGRKGENLLLLDVEMSLRDYHSELPELQMTKRGKKKPCKYFTFSSVAAATDNFSDSKKIGQGGFGPVYKGTLHKGDEVAIKRLSRKSKQGMQQLKNEAHLIARLQHRNLVRLLGCCIERKEQILIYEYMPNKSLDFFLFDSTRRRRLTWQIRVRIIEGIAQGLLYLHQYSRIRIIHRDLKASNILLDNEMNPKISDFGMATIFRVNQSHANAEQIGGTYGYIAPEYAQQGLVSDKVDVYSFGVLLLEIVSGKRNTTDFQNSETRSILAYAWTLWISDRGLDLMDPSLEDQSATHMILRYVHIALLCVQENAVDRPNMSQVVMMLSNSSLALPYPSQPAFLKSTTVVNPNPVQNRPEDISLNYVTLSVLESR